MARRRSRSLSGSPEHHSKQASSDAASAIMRYRKAQQMANEKKCQKAFFEITSAAAFTGASAAHENENKATPSEHRNMLLIREDGANVAFLRNCVVGGGFSGMRKRRSRR